jgi:hypothetical protein
MLPKLGEMALTRLPEPVVPAVILDPFRLGILASAKVPELTLLASNEVEVRDPETNTSP